MYGARISLSVGLGAAAIATAVGTLLGALSGFFGGWIDAVLMRLTDALLSIPTFFIALAVLTVFGNSIINLITVISLTSWMGVARLVRSECLRWKNREFVVAVQAMGASDARIMIRHLLPQAIPSILVAGTLAIAGAIAVESSLSYLGLGVQPPTPSLGNMLQKAQTYIWTRPELAVYPGVLISLTVLAYQFLGDGLRDALSPSQLGR
jgi:peptide/nickel transport system permease protein